MIVRETELKATFTNRFADFGDTQKRNTDAEKFVVLTFQIYVFGN